MEDPSSFILASINWSDIWLSVALTSVVLIVLLFCSAMISSSEVAFFSLSPGDRTVIGSKENKRAQTVIQLLERPKELLAVILIANNFINVAIILVSAFLSDTLLPQEMVGETTKFVFDVVVITFILLLFGEVIPKIYATKNGTKVALAMAVPLSLVGRAFPINLLKRGLVKGTRAISGATKKKSINVSSDELSHAIEMTIEENHDVQEQKILEGIVKFGKKDVKQIMISRVDVIAFEYATSFDEILAQVNKSGYSRIPIYRESFDSIAGILFIKDLIPHIDEKKDFNWQHLIRDPFFVPENKKIDDLLTNFQEKKIHMAVVVDEYGGTSGIVTLEDVLEEIVGDISEEFDDDDLVYSKLDDFNYVFEGKTPLIDFYRVINIDGKEFEAAKEESDTLAGFIIELAGKILKKNQRVTFNQYTFTVEAANNRKITRIKVNINPNFNNTDENE